VTGIDADARLVERARRRVPSGQFAVADAAQLPFAGASFDGLICANVLEFVADSAAVLAELRRVSRGRAVIVVLNRTSLWQVQQHLGRLVSDHPYYRGHFFDIERINAEARRAGWQVTSLEPTVFFPPLPVEVLLEWSEGRVDNACWVAGLVATT
jgi:2-polyprenyl-6-hydroxyphenyl methylase/3-demethylubiquinone-9 3-methyltransferase